ncbi:MAG: response regulator, partial [Microbacteriaceae bacterium]
MLIGRGFISIGYKPRQWTGLLMSPSGVRAIRVALVDEYRLVLEGISATLSHARTGITVVAAEPTWEGLLSHPAFPADVAIIDLNLGDGIPMKNKIGILAEAGCRTVVISRHADALSIRCALQSGASGFVAKTDQSRELVKAIRAAARGERHLSKTVAAAISGLAGREDPRLGDQELRALSLYASGQTIKEVAATMGTTEET